MKPADLKSPFTWANRHIIIEDNIWYVPHDYKNYDDFTFPGWNHSQLFKEEKPICVEYCSGNGAWIASKAEMHPEYNWVAIERKFERVRKIWAKIKNLNLSNLLIICGEGFCVTKHYLPSFSVKEVYINFPDPWPKQRHAKHRIVQVPFVEEIRRILQPQGLLTMVTDDEIHSQYMINTLHQVKGFQSEFPMPFYTKDYPNYGSSYFEDLWRQKGKSIRYHAFRKVEN